MLNRLRMAIRSAFDRDGVETEMDREMRHHLDMETEENIRRGMSSAEARRVALIAFGGFEVAKERVRDERETRFIDQLATDLRYTWRGMRRSPGFTAAVIMLLALGTGANTAIFSAVDQMILRPFAIPDGKRIVTMVATAGAGQFEVTPSQKLIDLWMTRARAVGEFAQFRYVHGAIGDTTRGSARELDGMAISPGLMEFVSMKPSLGRSIVGSDTLPNAPAVAMLSDKLWRAELGARGDIVGTSILFAGRPHTVVGVAPPEFFLPFGGRGEIYVARRAENAKSASQVIGKLRAGRTFEEASREAASLESLTRGQPGFSKNPPRLKDGSSLVRGSVKRIVLMLFGAVGLVLIIACANVANLLLARTWSRQREFAVRRAMGASRMRIARQIFTENLLLALIGGMAGFLVAMAVVRVMVRVQPDGVGMAGRIDLNVFAWSILISVVTGMLLAVAPLGLIGGGRLNEMLKSSTRSSTSSASTRRLRSGLVIAEVALSVVLLVGSGLLVRSILAMQRADAGFKPEGLASAAIMFPTFEFVESPERRDIRAAILRRVQETPGIEGAAMAYDAPPYFAASLRGIQLDGDAPGVDSLGAIAFNQGTDEFFRVAGMRFLQGRPYAPDNASEVVVNDRFARRFWPNGAIGHRFKSDSVWLTVVGVVASVDVPGEKGLKSGLQYYRPMISGPPRLALVVRSSLAPPALESALREAVLAVAPMVKLSQFNLATSQLSEGRAMHRFTLGLVGAFAGLALLLAAIGLHAVISYGVHQRMREIGIRIALGAQASQVARLVMRQGVTLALVGVIIGCVAGLAATRVMQSLLYGVTPRDPLTLALVAVMLIVVAVIACAIPARRATRVDPVEMVRAE